MIFIGNDYIHCLTTRTKQELRVDVQKFSGAKKYAKYSSFSVASEAAKYKLTVGDIVELQVTACLLIVFREKYPFYIYMYCIQ